MCDCSLFHVTNPPNTLLTADSVLGLVVGGGHVLDDPSLPLPPCSPVLLIKVGVGFILLLLAKKIELFIRIKIPKNKVFGKVF